MVKNIRLSSKNFNKVNSWAKARIKDGKTTPIPKTWNIEERIVLVSVLNYQRTKLEAQRNYVPKISLAEIAELIREAKAVAKRANEVRKGFYLDYHAVYRELLANRNNHAIAEWSMNYMNEASFTGKFGIEPDEIDKLCAVPISKALSPEENYRILLAKYYKGEGMLQSIELQQNISVRDFCYGETTDVTDAMELLIVT